MVCTSTFFKWKLPTFLCSRPIFTRRSEVPNVKHMAGFTMHVFLFDFSSLQTFNFHAISFFFPPLVIYSVSSEVSVSSHQSLSHPVVTWTVGPSLRGIVEESLTHKELFTRQNAPSGHILIVCVCVVCVCVCVKASTANTKHRLGFNSLSRTPRGINHGYKHSNCILSGWSHRSVICNILKAWNQKPNHTYTLNA